MNLYSKALKLRVRVITNKREAKDYIKSLTYHKFVALDFETTGLFPAEGAEVRLTAISAEKGEVVILDHFKCGKFEKFADDLIVAQHYYVFNNKFEINFFDHYSKNKKVRVHCLDVGNMRKAVLGGGPLNFASMCKRDLNVTLSKELQASNWSAKKLTKQQYWYAGKDAHYTRELAVLWDAEMTPERYNGFRTINDSARAVIEMERTGIHVNEGYHKGLCKMWERREATAAKALRRQVPVSKLNNLNSKIQLSNLMKRNLPKEALEGWPATQKTGQLSFTRDDLRKLSMRAEYPLSRFLTGLMVYNKAAKYVSTYGETLITKQRLSNDNRVHGRINIAQAITGRMSSSYPNMQNFPKAPQVRRSFEAERGNKLIIADYSSVEVRVLAELSGDETLLHDCIYGDVHSESAIAIYKVARKKFFKLIKKGDPTAKSMRGKAKGFTFQLLYGAGPDALAVVLRCSYEEACDAIEAWARRYPKAYAYRQKMFEMMMDDGFMPCASGRTIYVTKRERDMPKAANYPIQGSAGDVMYRAMHHAESTIHKLRTGLMHKDLGNDIKIVVTVHDELLFECKKKNAKTAKKLLEKVMIQGWLDVFPDTNTDNLAEAAIGDTWGDKE